LVAPRVALTFSPASPHRGRLREFWEKFALPDLPSVVSG
jgi:hypothetical protein